MMRLVSHVNGHVQLFRLANLERPTCEESGLPTMVRLLRAGARSIVNPGGITLDAKEWTQSVHSHHQTLQCSSRAYFLVRYT